MAKKRNLKRIILLFVLVTGGCSSPQAQYALGTPTTVVETATTSVVTSDEVTTPISNNTVFPGFQPILKGRIAFVGPSKNNQNIRYINLDDKSFQNVSGMGYDSLSWSPDGKWIAFDGGEPLSQNIEIYIIKPDGTKLRRLTNNTVGESDLNWSPDGKSIAYTLNDNKNPSDLAFININTQKSTLLTKTNGYENHPAWSPDGSQIAYLYSEDSDSPLRLWLMNSDGNNAKLLLNYPIAFSRIGWSPDGKRIAFISPENYENCGDIYTVNADGTNLQRLIKLSDCATDLVWSPDGQYIAFVGINKSNTNSWRIYVMEAKDERNISILDEEKLIINDLDWK